MSDIGSGTGNSGFDLAFFVLEIVALFASVALGGFARRSQSPALLPIQIAIGLAAGVALPMIWNMGWPASNGFEGAGRILLGGAASGLNAVACAVGCAFSPRLSGREKLLNAITQLGAAAGYWCFLLRS